MKAKRSPEITAKKIKQEIIKKRALEIAAGIPATPPTLFVGPERVQFPGEKSPAPGQPLLLRVPWQGTCRLHGQPWKFCLLCSKGATR